MSKYTTPTARKQHTCTACGHAIDKGERYHRHEFTPWDPGECDDFSTWKLHEFCNRIIDRSMEMSDNLDGVEAREAFLEWLSDLWKLNGLAHEYHILQLVEICKSPILERRDEGFVRRKKTRLDLELSSYGGNILDVEAIRREVGI